MSSSASKGDFLKADQTVLTFAAEPFKVLRQARRWPRRLPWLLIKVEAASLITDPPGACWWEPHPRGKPIP